MNFSVNQIVKGAVAGTFVIIGFRKIAGEDYAQVKEYCQVTGKVNRGEIALPLTALKEVA